MIHKNFSYTLVMNSKTVNVAIVSRLLLLPYPRECIFLDQSCYVRALESFSYLWKPNNAEAPQWAAIVKVNLPHCCIFCICSECNEHQTWNLLMLCIRQREVILTDSGIKNIIIPSNSKHELFLLYTFLFLICYGTTSWTTAVAL